MSLLLGDGIMEVMCLVQLVMRYTKNIYSEEDIGTCASADVGEPKDMAERERYGSCSFSSYHMIILLVLDRQASTA